MNVQLAYWSNPSNIARFKTKIVKTKIFKLHHCQGDRPMETR